MFCAVNTKFMTPTESTELTTISPVVLLISSNPPSAPFDRRRWEDGDCVSPKATSPTWPDAFATATTVAIAVSTAMDMDMSSSRGARGTQLGSMKPAGQAQTNPAAAVALAAQTPPLKQGLSEQISVSQFSPTKPLPHRQAVPEAVAIQDWPLAQSSASCSVQISSKGRNMVVVVVSVRVVAGIVAGSVGMVISRVVEFGWVGGGSMLTRTSIAPLRQGPVCARTTSTSAHWVAPTDQSSRRSVRIWPVCRSTSNCDE